MSVTNPQEPETSDEAPATKPLDPRRAPDVLFALETAARRDPHPDPLKPVGRASFLIWVAMLGTLALAGGGVSTFIDLPKLEAQVQGTYQGLIGSQRERARAIKEIRRNQHKMEVAAVAGFAGGTFLFALYYALVYLLGMNTRRLAAEIGVVFHAGAQRARAVARRVRTWRRNRAASDQTVVEEQTPAGQPHLQ